MQIEPVGFLNDKLYRLGWQNRLHRYLPRLRHHLLSLFLYYRRGFADGAEWIKQHERTVGHQPFHEFE
jgi:hypothetical protein